MNAPASITLSIDHGTIKITNPGPEASINIDLKPLLIPSFRHQRNDEPSPFDADDPAMIPSRPLLARFTDNNDGTITDHSTGLMWSKATNSSKCINHAEAVKACADLDLAGHTDWRLPTRTELLSLVDDTRHAPAIDIDVFSDTKNDWYWTSTIAAWSSGYAWIVYFGNGDAGDFHRANGGAFARAVRVAVVPGQ